MNIENTYPNYEMGKRPLRSDQPVSDNVGSISESKKSSIEDKGTNPDAVVNISQASKEAQLIEKTIAKTPDIRNEKVMAIKEKINTGQYDVNPQAIADKMVEYFTNNPFI